ncbi:sulfite oxidase-like oxidoreductase [Duganella sp. sic0402]|uniref:sulfite oxidase-like oxidoreductase n=1 Tax=Duganella sp. sic0402 TaxID=2854786 RepID=UPI001E5F0776|nr:sulfite oxidase-like oxidoreductase [Duganella sp. sic0402]
MSIRKLLIALTLSASTAWAHPDLNNASKYVTTELSVTGAVEHPLKLDVNDLRQFPLEQQQNRNGVTLRALLDRAKVISSNHNDVKKMAIIATASDGYAVVYSWSEIFNSPIGESVLIFFEKDGKALADDEGRIAMISTKDLRTGPRHVRWLKSIEIRKIVD